MSNRVLKKLHGGKDDLAVLATNLQLSDEEVDVPLPASRNSKKKTAINMFDLVRSNYTFTTEVLTLL